MGRLAKSRERTERGRRIAAALEGAWRRAPPPLSLSPEELGRVAPILTGTGAGALAWCRIRSTEQALGPAADAFKDAYRLNTLTDAVQEERVARAVGCLRGARIEPFLAKGWAAARLYPEPGLRPSGDIDLYVPRDRHPEARQALEAGRAAGGVDLHRGFDELDDREPGQLLARSRTMVAAGVGVRVFGPEDHLRLLCLHLLRHGASRPLWLCDVGAAVESRPDGFDWDYFRSGSRWRAEAAVITLALARRLLGARVEGTGADDRGRALPSWLVPAVLRQWGGGPAWRDAMTGHLRSPAAALRELPRHWPNPIEATAGVRAPFDELPRLPFQLAFAALRAARFAARHLARRALGSRRLPG